MRDTLSCVDAIVVIVVICILTYCTIKFHSTHHCVKKHKETAYSTTCYGKTFQVCNTVPYQHEICDEYAPD